MNFLFNIIDPYLQSLLTAKGPVERLLVYLIRTQIALFMTKNVQSRPIAWNCCPNTKMENAQKTTKYVMKLKSMNSLEISWCFRLLKCVNCDYFFQFRLPIYTLILVSMEERKVQDVTKTAI